MQRLVAGLLALTLLVGVAPVGPTEATDFRTPPNAVTWTVDQAAKTITVIVRLQIYSSCSDCPGVVNQFLADKIKAQIEQIWNQHYHYKCYTLIFDVDVTLATDRFHIDDDRVGVMIDNSPVTVRSHVSGMGTIKSTWKSSDPKDRFVPTNDSVNPTRWAESLSAGGYNLELDAGRRVYIPKFTYAHEYGHVLGLQDAYEDKVVDGQTVSVPYPDAPRDLMADSTIGQISQGTIDRLVTRNVPNMRDTGGKQITSKDLMKCDYRFNWSPAWTYVGKKCDGPGGTWTIALTVPGAAQGTVIVTLDEDTLEGKAHTEYTAGGAKYVLDGTAKFIDSPTGDPRTQPPHLVIDHGSGYATAFGRRIAVTGGRATIPLEEGKFCS